MPSFTSEISMSVRLFNISQDFLLVLYRMINKKEIFTVNFVSIIDLFKRLERNDSQARKTPNPLKNT
jgi:hypothetical protein